MSAHTWLVVAIVTVPWLVLGGVLWKWGGSDPDNGLYQEQDGSRRDRDDDAGDLLAAA